MGQYYKVVTLEEVSGRKEPIIEIYDRTVNNEYMMAKLMEFSYINNMFMEAFCMQELYLQPKRVATVGDYAKDEELKYGLTMRKIWGAKVKDKKLWHEPCKKDPVCNKLLINYDKKEYIDIAQYIKYTKVNRKDKKEKWFVHPLSLLTAVGNGRGGGDYEGTCMDLIGRWAWDTIGIEDKKAEKLLKKEGHVILDEVLFDE